MNCFRESIVYLLTNHLPIPSDTAETYKLTSFSSTISNANSEQEITTDVDESSDLTNSSNSLLVSRPNSTNNLGNNPRLNSRSNSLTYVTTAEDSNETTATTSFHQKPVHINTLRGSETSLEDSKVSLSEQFVTETTHTQSQTKSYREKLQTDETAKSRTAKTSLKGTDENEEELTKLTIVTSPNNFYIPTTSKSFFAFSSNLSAVPTSNDQIQYPNINLSANYVPQEQPVTSANPHVVMSTSTITDIKIESENIPQVESLRFALEPKHDNEISSNDENFYVTKVTVSTFKITGKSPKMKKAKVLMRSTNSIQPLVLENGDELIDGDQSETLVNQFTRWILHDELSEFELLNKEALISLFERKLVDDRDRQINHHEQQLLLNENDDKNLFQQDLNASPEQTNFQATSEQTPAALTTPAVSSSNIIINNGFSFQNADHSDINEPEKKETLFQETDLEHFAFVDEPFFISANLNSVDGTSVKKTKSQTIDETQLRDKEDVPQKFYNGNTKHSKSDDPLFNENEGSSIIFPDVQTDLTSMAALNGNINNAITSEYAIGDELDSTITFEGEDDTDHQAVKSFNPEAIHKKLTILDALNRNDADEILGIVNNVSPDHFPVYEDTNQYGSADSHFDHDKENSYFSDDGKPILQFCFRILHLLLLM